MNINEFIEVLDQLFEEKRINDVEPFLNKSLAQAISEGDASAQFTILNEMMGFFRDTSQYDKSIQACHQCINLMKNMGIEGSVDYATSLQNIANAHRAAGLLKESLEFYNQAFQIYENNISSGDYRFASLNNNIALLYQEMGDYDNAVKHLKRALEIINNIEGAEIQVAVTHSNLGASLIELNRVDEAVTHLEMALEIFRRDAVKDFHYSAALSAMAAAKCKKGDYMSAAKLYEEALEEININMGKGTAYKITEENLRKVYGKLGLKKNLNTQTDVTGMELSRKFYEQYGKMMIHEKFSEYENKIAVGLVGEGSERFGLDDEYSRDHDFGPGFCMWVTKATYEEIGEKLQEEYDKLPEEFMGIKAYKTKMAQGRCGVIRIGDFFKKYTGYEQPPKTVGEWVEIEDYKLATVTNGEVFKDEEGIFSSIREEFANIPETVRWVKIAREVAAMAQTGQCNYERAMARRDDVTAAICISEFMQHTMKTVYLLNGKYAPYYKWMFQGMSRLSILSQVGEKLSELAGTPNQREKWEGYKYSNLAPNQNDKNVMIMEIIAQFIIAELKNQKMADESIQSDFLNDYSVAIMNELEKKATNNRRKAMDRKKVIDEIINLEFEAFDKVQNVGGRAECQNNFPTFYVMRKSQYLTWTDEMLLTIRKLWLDNKTKGWNMITEKYGRMMESTAPEEYEQIKANFPEKSERTRQIVNQIAEIQVEWMKDFASKYPKLAFNARDITSDADDLDNASYETYLKGELLTYSDELLSMYAKFVVDIYRKGKNLAAMTIENTVKLQGYDSLDAAEADL